MRKNKDFLEEYPPMLSTGNFIIYSVSLKRFRAYTFTSQYEGAVSASKHKVKEVRLSEGQSQEI